MEPFDLYNQEPFSIPKKLDSEAFIDKEKAKVKKMAYLMSFGDMTIQYDFSLN